MAWWTPSRSTTATMLVRDLIDTIVRNRQFLSEIDGIGRSARLGPRSIGGRSQPKVDLISQYEAAHRQ